MLSLDEFLQSLLARPSKSKPKPRSKMSLPFDLKCIEGMAIVESQIRPGCWCVRYRGGWWTARCDRNLLLQLEAEVYVIGRDGNALLVWLVPPDAPTMLGAS